MACCGKKKCSCKSRAPKRAAKKITGKTKRPSMKAKAPRKRGY